jgi:ABC-type dipeptide/oligopeptide/nickel transport system permease component
MANFLRFVATRAVLAVITLLLVSFLVFTLMEMVPGDCAERYLAYKNTQGQNLTREDIDAERARLGLDQPFLYRWVVWVGGGFHWRLWGKLHPSGGHQPAARLQIPDFSWHLLCGPLRGLSDCHPSGDFRRAVA